MNLNGFVSDFVRQKFNEAYRDSLYMEFSCICIIIIIFVEIVY